MATVPHAFIVCGLCVIVVSSFLNDRAHLVPHDPSKAAARASYVYCAAQYRALRSPSSAYLFLRKLGQRTSATVNLTRSFKHRILLKISLTIRNF